jgi:hypothetical protein
MSLLDLSAGYYKIAERESIALGAGGVKIKRVHILRVQRYGNHMTFFIDNDVFGRSPSQLENFDTEYELIEKFVGEPQIHDCQITITFHDHARNKYLWTVKDAWALRHLFDTLKWLQKPFNFLPNRSRVVKE